MKILHLLSQRPDATGSGITLQNIVAQAHHRGFDNHVLAGVPCKYEPPAHLLPHSAVSLIRFEDEIPFTIPGMSDAMPYPSMRFQDMTPQQFEQYVMIFDRKLRDLRQQFKPDIVHAHHLWIMTSIARSVFSDIPFFVSAHGSDQRQYHLSPQFRDFVVSGCKKIDAVFALTRAHRDIIEATTGINKRLIHIVGAGYNSRLFNASGRQIKAPGASIRILYAGKFSRAKGVPYLLKALSQMTDMQWQLDMAGGGDGPEYDECIKLATSMPDRVHIHGLINQQQLAEIMRQSDIFVLPSFYEGLPLVLIEALASGCRLIATALPGVTELLSTLPASIARIVPLPALHSTDKPVDAAIPVFVRDMENALRDTLSDHQHALGEPSIAHVLQAHSWEAIFDAMETVYNST